MAYTAFNRGYTSEFRHMEGVLIKFQLFFLHLQLISLHIITIFRVLSSKEEALLMVGFIMKKGICETGEMEDHRISFLVHMRRG